MKHLDNQQGFSLVENLIASAIVTIGLLALLNLAAVSVYASRKGKDISIADNLAKQIIEDMKNVSYTSTMNNMGPHTVTDGVNNVFVYGARTVVTQTQTEIKVTQPVTVGTKVFNIQVDALTDNPKPMMVKIDVTISWTTALNSHSTDYITYLSSY